MSELEKIRIRDISTHVKGDKERKPTVIEVEAGGIKFRVHRHISYPGTWLLTCDELGVEHENLRTDDIEEALHSAKIFMVGVIYGFVAVLAAARVVLVREE